MYISWPCHGWWKHLSLHPISSAYLKYMICMHCHTTVLGTRGLAWFLLCCSLMYCTCTQVAFTPLWWKTEQVHRHVPIAAPWDTYRKGTIQDHKNCGCAYSYCMHIAHALPMPSNTLVEYQFSSCCCWTKVGGTEHCSIYFSFVTPKMRGKIDGDIDFQKGK